MKAVVITEPGAIAIERLDDPTPGANEVVVAVEAVGLCGTDVHLLDGEFPASYPLVPGHEFCGSVVATGRDARGVPEGSFVCVDPSLHCGHCRFCREGRGNLCETWGAIGVSTAGACADFVAVPAASVHPLPDRVPRRHGTVVEPLACAVHGFDQVGVRLGADYLIYGAGTMGLLLAQLAANAGAASVSVVDLNASRLPRATNLGATHVAVSADELHHPGGWHVVIDATGTIPAIEDGMRRVRRGGTFLNFGVVAQKSTARISPFQIYHDEVRVIGSMAVLHSFARARDLLMQGAVNVDPILTHLMPLDAYGEAIDTFRAGDGLKIQVTPQSEHSLTTQPSVSTGEHPDGLSRNIQAAP